MVRNTQAGSDRHSALWRNLLIGATLGVAVLVTVLLVRGTPPDPPPPSAPPPAATGAQLHVDPAASAAGDGSEAAPLQTIQQALDLAEPGTTIHLAPGEYHEQPSTTHDGAPGAPITIKGPETGTDPAGRHKATLYGTDRIFNIDHSHYRLEGFTIDGQEGLDDQQLPTDPAAATAFKDSVRGQINDGRLIYIGSADWSRDITDVTITNMFLTGAGGECVRLRNNAHDNVISNSVIQYCGMYAKDDDDGDSFTYHNGEGVYIGTSPKSDDQPMHENDSSHGNQVTGNVIRTFGSECFNVKENAYANVFEDNACSGNTESAEFDGSNIELRGHDNIVRNNTITDSAGHAVKIKSDDDEYDKGGNVVEDNEISGIAGAAFQIETEAQQGSMCGNQVSAAAVLDDEDDDEDSGNDLQRIDQPC